MKKRFLSLTLILALLFTTACVNVQLNITVKFESNGGTPCASAEFFRATSMITMPDDPVREGYTFGGWYWDNGVWEKPFTINSVLDQPLSGKMELTVYAKWLPVNNNNGGNNNGGNENGGNNNGGGNENGGGLGADALKIAVIAKGYGSVYAKALAKAYTKKTGVDAAVVRETVESSFVENSLKAGPDKNEIDLYFGIDNYPNFILAQNNFIEGYGRALADLSDIYESPAVGYKELDTNPALKVKDIIDPFMLDAFTFSDGKLYSAPYAAGVTGLIYNKTLWDSVNAKLTQNGQAALILPRTTEEMFALFDHIKALKDGSVPSSYRISSNAYPFVYSGTGSYMDVGFKAWFAQYEGQDFMGKFYEGKDINGVYTPEIYNTNGRLYSYETVRKIILSANGYTDPINFSIEFTKAQLDFLEGKAFFHFNGDWLERESSENFKPGDVDVASFIKTPILSKIIDKLSSVNTDAQLSEAINYIDGGCARPSWLSAPDETLLREARNAVSTYGPALCALVPAYSKNLDTAKDFLKFMLSKEGQEIMLANSCGTMAPLTVDPAQFDYYKNATVLTKSKFDMMQGALYVGDTMKHPMQYLGGLRLQRSFSMEAAFGGTAAQTAAQFMNDEYNKVKSIWADMMIHAGVLDWDFD